MIKWPAGKEKLALKKFCRTHRQSILRGQLVSIDPASISAGWALFDFTELCQSGTIAASAKLPAHQRLESLYYQLQETIKPFCEPQIVAIEKIRGRTSPPQLWWSVGVLQIALVPQAVIEVPISFWKKLAELDPDYRKSDEQDAIKIGQAIIEFTKELK